MVSEKKKDFVQKLTKLIQTYPVTALVNMQNLPTKQLQNMRKQLLKKDIFIAMARKKLLQLALKNSQKQNIEQLIQKMKGMPALLLAKENPFILYAILQKNKSPAPAKANQIAPKDIIVPAGPTNFAPGPIISELANVGIKTKVEGGKLVIVQDTTVAKEDDIISLKLAELLKRLDIQPMEIGLNLVAVWENEFIFDAQQLHIDEREYFNNIILSFREAFNLAVEIAYPTSDNIGLLLQKAFQESKTLASEQNILTDQTTGEILAKTEQQALALKETAGIEVPIKEGKPAEKEEAKNEVGEEKEEKKGPETPAEEKPEEPAEKEEKPEETPVEEPKEEVPEPEVEEKPAEEALEEEKPEETPVEEVKEEPKEEPETPAELSSESEKLSNKDEKGLRDSKNLGKGLENSKNSQRSPPREVEKEPETQEEKGVELKKEPAAPEETPEDKAPEPKPESRPKTEDIPSAEDLIKATKERFIQETSEDKTKVVEVTTSAEEMIKAAQEKFDPNLAKEPQLSAEELVAEEKREEEKKKPKKDKDVEEAESLLEKLKKQGTLRE